MADHGQRIRPADFAARHAARFPGQAGAQLDPTREHDACGVGFIADASGRRSHEVVARALEAVARVAHRGAVSTDNSGDGAGVLTQIPERLLRREAVQLGFAGAAAAPFAVAVLFLPQDAAGAAAGMAVVRAVLAQDALPFLGVRDVPVAPAVLGTAAREAMPIIRQVLIGRPEGILDDDAWERDLYLARRAMEKRAEAQGLDGFYVPSCSCRTMVLKALSSGAQLPGFYTDFRSPDFESAIALFHQRYSTNTLPSWPLAQPFRHLAHNGEINTLWGNRNAMTMRESLLASPLWGDKVQRLQQVIWAKGSDSASLDNAMELLVRSGRDPVHAAMMMIPQAWEKYPDVHPDIRAFYEYSQCLLEPWDGPAAVAYSDGLVAGAVVDRNGLRPCRYKVTRDGLVVVGSEVGLVDVEPEDVIESGKVGPGEVLVVDTVRGRVIRNRDAKMEVATRRPYASWVRRYMQTLVPDPLGSAPPISTPQLHAAQQAFGYGFEDLRLVLEPMGATGGDPVWSMGDDTPLAPLAHFAPSVYGYFRQRFAQVTNPPIDSLRESMVMSLRMHLGQRGSPLVERPTHARMLRVEHPIILPDEMSALRNTPGFQPIVVDALWDPNAGPSGLKPALQRLAQACDKAVRGGARLLVLSDRRADARHAPIPMLLAVGAVRQHLVEKGLRARVGLVAECGDAFDIHHFAALVGYGAEAVHPWLAIASVERIFSEEPHGREAKDAAARPTPAEAVQRFRTAAEKGLLKILSKMGISTLSSYCGAQIFEALGLGADVIDTCFEGTVSPLGGIGFEELGEDVLGRHRAAFAPDLADARDALPDFGRVRFRKEGEDHGWAPTTVVALQQAIRSGAPEKYDAYLARTADRRASSPRDLLQFRSAPAPIALDDVEPVAAITARFISSAMSLGALSPEAHATLSIAMNRIGARSNCGEGGEDPAHFQPLANGDRIDNRIKQVASGRFGVTTEYLVRAEELEIKVVQGAKPGEGGQLPGIKVTDLIARLRHATVGVGLISPPPHHDIYSIEDLAQLIHDLKTVNPRARIGVKLVAESGVGTVASGVAKAYADYVLIAGHNGGTGASPLSSIKHAGSPWELGLAEAQQALTRNGLRERIEVRTDGGLKTGRDVVMAALLGAEAYGFGTAPLVAIGCAMARQCHANTCPTGIATQRDDLRAKYKGTPEQVVAFFTFVAEEVRRLLAALGARTIQEIIGRTDLLERAERPEQPRAQMLDLSFLLAPPKPGAARTRVQPRNDRPGFLSLDDEILTELRPYVEAAKHCGGAYAIRNHHLTVGARIAGVIASRFGDAGVPPGTVQLQFTGSAGQSFGAFTCRGMELSLEGEANDYVGKGLSGGEIAVRPFRRVAYAETAHEHLIIGNVALYGATAGKLFAAGQAGDRFAVRNSGAIAVIEGAGNHCCEYMTGGIVAVLGRAGRNFGAGMSNGVAYVLDADGTLASRTNFDMVTLDALDHDDEQVLLALMHEHEHRTGSPHARRLLASWDEHRLLFRRIAPRGGAALVTAIRSRYHATLHPGSTETAGV